MRLCVCSPRGSPPDCGHTGRLRCTHAGERYGGVPSSEGDTHSERRAGAVDRDDQPGGRPTRPPATHPALGSHPMGGPARRSRRAVPEPSADQPQPHPARPRSPRFRRTGRRSGSPRRRGRIRPPGRDTGRGGPGRNGPRGRRRCRTGSSGGDRTRTLGTGRHRCTAWRPARKRGPLPRRSAADHRLGRGRRTGRTAGRTGPARTRRGRAVRLRRQWHLDHPGRRRGEPGADRRDRPRRGLLRRPDRPGSARPGAGRTPHRRVG